MTKRTTGRRSYGVCWSTNSNAEAVFRKRTFRAWSGPRGECLPTNPSPHRAHQAIGWMFQRAYAGPFTRRPNTGCRSTKASRPCALPILPMGGTDRAGLSCGLCTSPNSENGTTTIACAGPSRPPFPHGKARSNPASSAGVAAEVPSRRIAGSAHTLVQGLGPCLTAWNGPFVSCAGQAMLAHARCAENGRA